MRKIFIILGWWFLTGCLAATGNSVPPVSHEAVVLETVSSAEVLVEATGVYQSPYKSLRKARKEIRQQGVEKARRDARRAALYLLLEGGTDPLLKTPAERAAFSLQAEEFFSPEKTARYITWEASTLEKKVTLNQGRGVKVVVRMKINVRLLRRDLEEARILGTLAELSASVGLPTIMVLPAATDGVPPLKRLEEDPDARQAAAVLESFLTARGYDVVIPRQQQALEALNAAQFQVEEREEDYSYRLALAVGSDIYLSFSGNWEPGAYSTRRYTLQVRAYESTTARALGTETGYSKERREESALSVEEAANAAVENVLSRIQAYWQRDLQQGIQYKIIADFSEEWDEQELENLQFTLEDALEEISRRLKEQVLTGHTLEVSVWCDPREFPGSSAVYRALKREFTRRAPDALLGRVSLNRKLLLLTVDPQ